MMVLMVMNKHYVSLRGKAFKTQSRLAVKELTVILWAGAAPSSCEVLGRSPSLSGFPICDVTALG